MLSHIPRRRRHVASVLTLCVSVGVVLTACGGSGYQYIESSQGNALFKMPETWTVFDEDEVFATQGEGISPQRAEAAKASQWLVAFDAGPRPSLDNVLQGSPQHPTGFAKVRLLGDEERDTYSLASLRNSVFPLDEMSKEEDKVEILETQDLLLEGGFRGSRIVFNLKQGNDFMTINQTGLVDPATRVLYLLVIGCEASCYADNQGDIEEVVSSWTIKER